MARVDQCFAAPRPDRCDSDIARQDAFEQHLEAARSRENDRHSRPANDNVNAVTVKPGDTMWDIARRNGVALNDLYEANPRFDPKREDGVPHPDRSANGGWDPDYIRPGDRINLPPAQRHPDDQPAGPHQPPGHGGPHGPGPHQPPGHGGPHGPGPHHQPPGHGGPAGPGPHQPPGTQPPPGTPGNGGPQQPGAQPGLAPPLAPYVPGSQGFKFGGGLEFSGRGSAKPSGGVEPYAKFSVPLGPWALNGKLKYTPQGPLGPAKAGQNGQPKPSLLSRLKMEKGTLDLGLVIDKKVEFGASFEVRGLKVSLNGGKPSVTGWKPSVSYYASKKDPGNVLVDTAQVKLGKIKPGDFFKALASGTKASLAQSKADAAANGRWAPFRQEVWKAVNNGELQVAGEKAFLTDGPGSLFGNFAGKTALKDIGHAMEPVPSASGLTRLTGFAAGTGASILGAGLTDELVGKDIKNPILRKAVDGFGGGMTGVAVDGVVQKTLPAIAAKAGPALSRAAAPVARAVAPALGRAASAAAPVLARAAPVLAKAAPALSVASKVARVGGPAGAVVAGIPDGIDAYSNFKNGNTAEGWKSVGRAAVRVGATAAGAVIGQALIPIPGVGAVVGGVVGGVAGDLLAKLF